MESSTVQEEEEDDLEEDGKDEEEAGEESENEMEMEMLELMNTDEMLTWHRQITSRKALTVHHEHMRCWHHTIRLEAERC